MMNPSRESINNTLSPSERIIGFVNQSDKPISSIQLAVALGLDIVLVCHTLNKLAKSGDIKLVTEKNVRFWKLNKNHKETIRPQKAGRHKILL